MKDIKPSKYFMDKFMSADNLRSYSMNIDKDGEVTINGQTPDNITEFTDPSGNKWIKASMNYGDTDCNYDDMIIWHDWNNLINQHRVRQAGGKFWERVTFNTGQWFLEHWRWIKNMKQEKKL